MATASEQTVLLDTGPWVAFLNRRDQHHAWVTTQFARLRPALLTCEAVVSETCFLVRTLRGGVEAVLAFLERGVVQVPFRLQDEHTAVKTLLGQYADVPMSLADACLVRMSEQHPHSVVLTCDSDFQRYRRHRRQRIPTIMPDVR
jgi:predicted nucleic acid-binding protein